MDKFLAVAAEIDVNVLANQPEDVGPARGGGLVRGRDGGQAGGSQEQADRVHAHPVGWDSWPDRIGSETEAILGCGRFRPAAVSDRRPSARPCGTHPGLAVRPPLGVAHGWLQIGSQVPPLRRVARDGTLPRGKALYHFTTGKEAAGTDSARPR